MADRGLAQIERAGQVAHADFPAVAGADQGNQSQPDRVAQRLEDLRQADSRGLVDRPPHHDACHRRPRDNPATRHATVRHRHAEIAKRIDIAATAIYHNTTVEDMSDLDLSYTSPLGSPWEAVQMAAQAWDRQVQPHGT